MLIDKNIIDILRDYSFILLQVPIPDVKNFTNQLVTQRYPRYRNVTEYHVNMSNKK
jgi:hypothetical protein